MAEQQMDTDALLTRIEHGEADAMAPLLARYRSRLKRLVSLRMDQRMAGRVDPSDIVQETLVKAAERLPAYASRRPLPFYPWLRQLAIERLVEAHRLHIQSQRRSVLRERELAFGLSETGRTSLAECLATLSRSPSANLRRQEMMEQAQAIVERLPHRDRDVLVLRYLEQLSTRDAAAVLGISENTFAQRHVRALQRVRQLACECEGSD